MKNFLKLTLAGILALTVTEVYGQRSFDTFGAPRVIALGSANISGGAAGITTNGPVDIRTLDGICKVDILCYTNSGTTGGTMTAQIYGSTDRTNWTAFSSVAIITNTTQINYTNTYYGGTNLIVTNFWMLPYTITTPTAATAGFATLYPGSPVQFTNSAAINLNLNGWNEFGFNAGDALRYFEVVFQPGGSATNFTVGTIITGMTHDTLIR